MISQEAISDVLVLTIARPERRNALATDIVAELDRCLTAASADQSVRAIVLTGAAPSFCAGSDLKELARLDVDGMVAHELETARVARRIGLIDIPVVAAVEGYALGGGFILAASCDLVVTSEKATWSLPEVPNGWLPPWGLRAVAMRVGMATARRLVWGFETMDGATALATGIADYCVPEGTARSEAIKIAEKLASLPRTSVSSAKRYFQAELLGDAELWDERAARAFAMDCAYPEAKATLARFAAKHQ